MSAPFERGDPSKLTKITDGCENRSCPAVYETDRGTLVVQGYVLSDPQALKQIGLPEGESAVEVPTELLRGVRAVSD
ncbi:hypothetical protein OUQ99_30015 [Streptomonospora nanhaiensis]|uniref:Uncharacterized protein n=1 Tax=Streptomonospora nanhaiensis TaxID=1323731 RepID=A0ABY6YM11_9ACTN|nr:hypothetical protein [Streptomonospora nanhaiensis]WAE73330.1 hypothetical protein OUQ99_30015 [Streptomonospora nanhaiensis]